MTSTHPVPSSGHCGWLFGMEPSRLFLGIFVFFTSMWSFASGFLPPVRHGVGGAPQLHIDPPAHLYSTLLFTHYLLLAGFVSVSGGMLG